MRFLLIILLAMAASCGADLATCEQVTHDGVEYCVYEGPITETGYICPPDQPNMFRDEGSELVVCSGEPQRPPFDDVNTAFEEAQAAQDNPGLERRDERPTQRVVNTTSNDDCEDNDGDGFGAGSDESRASCPKCVDEGRCAVDCDDDDPSVNPGLIDTCDGVDNDCDGTIDEPVECESSFDCPNENPYIPTCTNQRCQYGTPVQIDIACSEPVACVAGARDQRPDQCF